MKLYQAPQPRVTRPPYRRKCAAAATALGLLALASTHGLETAQAQSSSGVRVVQKPAMRSAVFYQSVTGIATASSVMEGSIGLLAGDDRSAVSFGMAKIVDNVIDGLQAQTYPTTDRLAQLSLAKTRILGAVDPLAARLLAWVLANSVSQATYYLSQQIQITGRAQAMQLRWRLTVDRDGNKLYGDPEIVDGNPVMLHATYTAKNSVDGLPNTLSGAAGGQLTYVLKDLAGVALSAPVTINTGGAFDEPTGNNVALSQEDMVACLAMKISGCPTVAGFTDLKTVAASLGTREILLDYGRRIAPSYVEANGPTPGTTEYVASPSGLNFTQRSMRWAECATTSAYRFGSKGTYQLDVTQTVDRYFFDEGFAPQFMTSASASLGQTPIPFDVEAPISDAQKSTVDKEGQMDFGKLVPGYAVSPYEPAFKPKTDMVVTGTWPSVVSGWPAATGSYVPDPWGYGYTMWQPTISTPSALTAPANSHTDWRANIAAPTFWNPTQGKYYPPAMRTMALVGYTSWGAPYGIESPGPNQIITRTITFNANKAALNYIGFCGGQNGTYVSTKIYLNGQLAWSWTPAPAGSPWWVFPTTWAANVMPLLNNGANTLVMQSTFSADTGETAMGNLDVVFY